MLDRLKPFSHMNGLGSCIHVNFKVAVSWLGKTEQNSILLITRLVLNLLLHTMQQVLLRIIPSTKTLGQNQEMGWTNVRNWKLFVLWKFASIGSCNYTRVIGLASIQKMCFMNGILVTEKHYWRAPVVIHVFFYSLCFRGMLDIQSNTKISNVY